MTRRAWVEIECDHCLSCDYFAPGDVTDIARNHGWIITRKGEHFCSPDCYHEEMQHRKDYGDMAEQWGGLPLKGVEI
jgi:hypothetical protein